MILRKRHYSKGFILFKVLKMVEAVYRHIHVVFDGNRNFYLFLQIRSKRLSGQIRNITHADCPTLDHTGNPDPNRLNIHMSAD
ncbi:hypothetical protein D3C75_1131000 [compost metagenome]